MNSEHARTRFYINGTRPEIELNVIYASPTDTIHFIPVRFLPSSLLCDCLVVCLCFSSVLSRYFEDSFDFKNNLGFLWYMHEVKSVNGISARILWKMNFTFGRQCHRVYTQAFSSKRRKTSEENFNPNMTLMKKLVACQVHSKMMSSRYYNVISHSEPAPDASTKGQKLLVMVKW